MNIPSNLTIIHGARAPDGGSIFLDALDDQSRLRKIYLDWSDMAQHYGATSLDVDGTNVAKRSLEEAAWLKAIASATIDVPPAAANSPTQRNAIAAGLAATRDSLVEKVRSSAHEKNKPDVAS